MSIKNYLLYDFLSYYFFMSNSLTSDSFNLTDIGILDTLYPDIACTSEDFEEDFDMDIGNLLHDFKNFMIRVF